MGKKRETGEKQELRNKTLVDLTNKTNWQRTNRGDYGIMTKMGETWRGVETITRTGETDQGVTHL